MTTKVILATFFIAECEIFEFRCQFMGLCMDIDRWCDGHADCPDNSDEPLNCLNGRCVYRTFSSSNCIMTLVK
jgi:hypothetical protein